MTRQYPFYHIKNELRVISSIVRGELPPLPADFNDSGDIYKNLLWDLCNVCWKRDPEWRPSMRVIAYALSLLENSPTELSLEVCSLCFYFTYHTETISCNYKYFREVLESGKIPRPTPSQDAVPNLSLRSGAEDSDPVTGHELSTELSGIVYPRIQMNSVYKRLTSIFRTAEVHVS